MRWSIRNLVAQHDAAQLIDGLRADGFVVRRFDGGSASDEASLLRALGATFGFQPAGWDSVADDLWNALLPDDDEGDRVAFVWEHADAMLDHGLPAFLEAVDVIVGIGRQAYAADLTVLGFYLGDGANFPPCPAP